MEVPVQLESRLQRLSELTGRDAQALLQDAVERFADMEERFLNAVAAGVASSERGDLIEDDAVLAWMEERDRA
jgi:predicted transcriptional regulator